MEIQVGGRYRHYKGNTYVVLAVGRHSETGEKLVIYQSLYEDPEFGLHAVWVRPYDMFIEHVQVQEKTVPRFERIS